MSECLWAPGRLRWVGTGMGTPLGQSPRLHGALGSPGLLLMPVAQLGASVVSSVKWGEGAFSFLSPNWTLSFQAL